jgi:hypothetical protein
MSAGSNDRVIGMSLGRPRPMPEPPYLIDPKTIERFDARCTAFARAGQSRPAGRRAPAPGADHQVAAPTIALGDDELALAEARASRRVDHLLRSSLSEAENARPSVEDREARPPYEFANPEDASANVKAVATRFGACLAGVTAVNPLWLYSHDPAGARVELPQGLEFAVVMAVEMDRAQIRQSPGPLASAETGRGYSAMAALTVSLSEYLALLGYRALPSGNDTALSIPLAIDAGLGAMGRNGLLLTSDFGPCVRLCKVFTDLPLKRRCGAVLRGLWSVRGGLPCGGDLRRATAEPRHGRSVQPARGPPMGRGRRTLPRLLGGKRDELLNLYRGVPLRSRLTGRRASAAYTTTRSS